MRVRDILSGTKEQSPLAGCRGMRIGIASGGLTAALLFWSASVAHAQNFGPWGAAVSVDADRVGVNTSFNDGCPIEAPDGDRLFLASNRPGSQGLDIWVSLRELGDTDWTVPVNLAGVNSAANDFCPTPLPGNRLLFVSTRANHCGGSGNNPDIYFTRLHPVQGWLAPEPLPCGVNSGFEEFSPSLVEAEGLTMLFFSSSRDDAPRHQVYMAVLQPDGSWATAPVHELNWPGASDARPNVRHDGLEIVFDSTRAGGPPQIYSATRSSVFEPWSRPELLDTHVNLPGFAQTRPSISRDGRRLYFGSSRDNLPGDLAGGADVFVSTRSGPGKGRQE
jgi:Tol biopolymer transport system component